MKILVGADPEVFVTENGKLVSAYGMVEGTKKSPTPLKRGAVQVDGMALEFNINPASTLGQFRANINACMGQLQAIAQEQGREIAVVPTAEFGKEYIEAQPDEAKELGCDPDYNAWTGEINPKPDASLDFRTGAGHIHVGWTEGMDPNDPEHFEACCMLGKQLDSILGIASLLWDKDNKRRQMYGQPGAFRPKPYGMEYRVLSNAWLNDPDTITVVYELTTHAVNELLKGHQVYNIYYSYDDMHRYMCSKWDSASKIFDMMACTYAIPPHTSKYVNKLIKEERAAQAAKKVARAKSKAKAAVAEDIRGIHVEWDILN